jgi:NitT/TauT family transport system substrate-binding protein
MNKVFVIIYCILVLFACDKVPKNIKIEHSIKIGVKFDINSFPLVVAANEGFFKKEGLDVEIITMSKTIEKHKAFINGNVDIILTNLVKAAIIKNQGVDIKVIALLKGGATSQNRSAIVVAPDSPITSLESLRGKSIAILANNNISGFIVDQFFKDEGIESPNITKVPVEEYSCALDLLSKNKIAAALFPEPLVTFTQQQGYHVIIDDQENSLCYLGLVAHQSFSMSHPNTIKKLLKGYAKAVDEINKNPEAYRKMLLEYAALPGTDPSLLRKILLCMARAPQSIKTKIFMPTYDHPRDPEAYQFEQVIEWCKENNKIKESIPYHKLINLNTHKLYQKPENQ